MPQASLWAVVRRQRDLYWVTLLPLRNVSKSFAP